MSLDNVKGIEYKKSKEILEVMFTSGKISCYYPVSPTQFSELVTADNVAKAVHTLIRSGKVVGTEKKVS